MSDRFKSALSATYMKILFGGVIGFAGIVAGVYVGLALIQNRQTPAFDAEYLDQHTVPVVEEELQPNFKVGDLFPWEPYRLPDGTVGSFEDLLQGKKTALLIVRTGCGPCDELLLRWTNWVEPQLKPTVQTVVCLVGDPAAMSDEHGKLVGEMRLVYVSKDHLVNIYNIRMFPTLVCTDEFGLVTAIQMGFGEQIDSDVLHAIAIVEDI